MKKYNKWGTKGVFICASALLSVWLGATWTDGNVQAAETPDAGNQVSTEVNQRVITENEKKTVVQPAKDTQTDEKDTDNTQLASATPSEETTQVEEAKQQSLKDTTKVVVHYQGDGSKWVPYIWGKKPNGNGNQYKWDGKDDYGYYSNITVDGNEQEMGVLIKGKDSWDKDGQGNDRIVKVGDNGKAEVWYKEGSDEAQDVKPTYDSAKVNIHYQGNDDVTSISYWTNTDPQNKKIIDLSKSDVQEKEGSFDLSNTKFNSIFVAPIGTDTEVREFTPLPGKGATDIYLVTKDPTVYYTKSFALATQSLTSASMDSEKTVNIQTGKEMTAAEAKKNLSIKDNSIVNVVAVNPDQDGKSKQFTITTAQDLNILDNNQIGIYGNYKSIDIGSYVRSKDFDTKYYYNGDDLGATYTEKQSQIKLWAPTAKKVVLNLYDSLNNDASATKTFVMNRGDKGVWSVILPGDYKNWAYDYSLSFGNGTTTQTNDPYSKAVTINGDRSVIEDVDAIKPNDFSRLPQFSAPTNAIIYETSIRDFTSDKNSGIKDKGKYLGMIESGVTPDGQITGLDYLKSLGVTHVQIMPMFDFASINESMADDSYNWGYDPKNYNVPEGSYSSNAADPTTRIMEMKEMINGLHKAGIRVVMDVVYNHVYNTDEQSLNKTVPGYYFQYDSEGHTTNGTGCGNDMASERLMARKYIVDSVKYWAKNYNIDGFRFDLMGILDVDTMNEVRSELNKIDPSILVYGEGWDMRKTDHDIGAGQYNADKVDKSIGFFSDDIRNAIKGAEFGGVTPGLVEGNGKEENYKEDAKKFIDGFLGGQNYGKDAKHPYQAPEQTINYVACHDNRTLYDMLKTLMPDESEANIIKRDKLATSMMMLSQGIPFIHAGQESLGTKDGNENSYNASVEVNEINWGRVKENKDMVDYFKKLVNLRKSQSVFRQNDYSQINKNVKVLNDGQNGVFAFEYNTNGKKLYVAFNVNDKDAKLENVDLSVATKLLDSDGNTQIGKESVLKPLSTLVAEVSTKEAKPDDSSSIINPPVNTNIGDNNTDTLLSTVDIVLTHNAYIYENDGITTVKANDGKNVTLKVGQTIHALNKAQIVILNNKEFYQIGDNQYVKVNNTLNWNILKHNSFVYSKSGKALKKNHKRILLKKGHKVLLLDNACLTKIHGKQFYRIGNNKYVKAVNVVIEVKA